ncbi:hypothetical protein GRI39_02625 [Altererythrobacter indicus]|uniref:Peptidase M56 domain-containing protein n=1 Tax=Altericroceibacterium indicum TaxID=374177 RepID=A0A845A7B3_9SPHN|nr:M56 family metallopeptidase [Altericroceibacterium indicum]MXP24941.1 hypothetical protein [Altericroceibacterium indicum]
MTAHLLDFLLDTFIYSGVLIALVLILRRPVARHFGASYAYALWSLPLLRFLMPPIVLPASFAPAVQATDIAITPAASATFDTGPTVEPVITAQGWLSGWSASDALLSLWLLGALGFLVWRWVSYHQMREQLLADARPVGEAGKVRLVETSAVRSPVAFGVRDQVVALPDLFMAHPDRRARDLAIAHELAHHRGRDLLANIIAQPLLALHWFNPLAWLGWRAMRRDQEAACDARVMAGRNREDRAVYAHVIAGFAKGEHLALAAPMACPVLGEKSIIHRLRSLTMDEISERRRWVARGLIGAGALAIPLTASISYAEARHDHASAEIPAAPTAPEAPAAPEMSDLGSVPEAPPAPADVDDMLSVPPAPPAPGTYTYTYSHNIDPQVLKDIRATAAKSRKIAKAAQIARARGTWSDEDEARFERQMDQMEREMDAQSDRMDAEADRVEAQSDRMAAQAEAAAERAVAISEKAQAKAERQRAVAIAHAASANVRVNTKCSGNGKVTSTSTRNGQAVISICQSAAKSAAVQGLRAARQSISSNGAIPTAQRREAVAEIDQQIAEMSRES